MYHGNAPQSNKSETSGNKISSMFLSVSMGEQDERPNDMQYMYEQMPTPYLLLIKCRHFTDGVSTQS